MKSTTNLVESLLNGEVDIEEPESIYKFVSSGGDLSKIESKLSAATLDYMADFSSSMNDEETSKKFKDSYERAWAEIERGRRPRRYGHSYSRS